MKPPLDAATLKQWLGDPHTLLVDVREPAEFAREHIAGALSAPQSAFDAGKLPRNKRIVVCCQTGMRSRSCAEQLTAAGIEAVQLNGGLAAWKAAGLRTSVDRSQPISIMRQVQIVAGSLVVLGAVLAALVSPWFLLLAGFVGGGLLFAGVTDTCLMARLLSRLPYNQPKS